MRKIFDIKKFNSGVTLVALMITIIVLVILATISIRTVIGEGAINQAKNASSKWENGMSKKNALIENIQD